MGGYNNEPNDTGLCAQGIFQTFSGFINSLTGFGKPMSPETLESNKIIKDSHDSKFRGKELMLPKHDLIN
jgi:hypothetical protein